MPENLPSEWPANGYAMFISHSSADKLIGASIKSELEKYGIYGFLAHEDIEPGEHWRHVLLVALESMHSLLALSSKSFNESPWCQQEVGYALGLHKPHFTISLDEPPLAFASDRQAIKFTDAGTEKVVEYLVKTMLKHDRARITSALVGGLESAKNFARARTVGEFLIANTSVTPVDADRVKKAMIDNPQVRGANFERLVPSLEDWLTTCRPVEKVELPFEF
jgi:hypothetical protein